VAITHVASGIARGNSGGATLTLDSTGANLIVVTAHYYGGDGANPTNITDSRGNTWTALTRRAHTNSAVRQFYCLSPSVGTSHLFTWVGGSNTFNTLSVQCFAGVSAYSSETGATGSGTSLSTGSITPPSDGAVLIAGVTFDASSTESSSPYGGLQQSNFQTAVALGGASAYLIQSTAASTSNTFSGSSVGRATALSCFVASGGGPALSAGTASTTSSGNTIATVTATDASGGTSPYTYQWQRSTTSGSGFSNVSGATSLTLNDTGLTNGTTYYYRLVYTDSAAATATSNETSATPVANNDFAVNNSSLFLSPYNWRLSGSTYAETNNPGAYFKTKFSGASCTLLLNTTNQSSLSAGNYPAVAWQINGGAWQRSQLTSGQTTLSLATGLGSGPHTLDFVVCGAWWQSDRWSTPVSAVRITGLRLATGATLSASTLQTGRMILFADSNGEGYEALSSGVSVANQDANQAFPLVLGRALACEVGVIAFAGQGYNATGGGSVPDLEDAWDFYMSGQSRLSGGLLSPSPDYIVSTHGQNDSSATQAGAEACITQWLAAAPAAKIMLVSPMNLTQASAISAAVTAAASSRVKYTSPGDMSACSNYINSTHLSLRGHHVYASLIAGAIKTAFPAVGTNNALWFKLSEFVEINRP